MNDSTRFPAPISTARPRGVRIIEAYSPKLGRRLQCFGEEAFRQWICLEADPSITTFCERPAFLDTGGGKRLVDFWVCQQDREQLLVIDEKPLTSTFTIDDVELAVRTVLPVELAAARTWIGNWECMLPAITSCRQLLSRSLLHTVWKGICEPMQLSRIEAELGIDDLPLVRAAVFTLLHRGQLQAPCLHTEPLSFLSCFQPVRTTL